MTTVNKNKEEHCALKRQRRASYSGSTRSGATAATSNSRSDATSRPHRKTAKDGRPLVLNDRGYYVHDAKTAAKATAKELAQKTAALDAVLKVVDVNLNSTASATAPAPAPAASSSGSDAGSHRERMRQAHLAAMTPK